MGRINSLPLLTIRRRITAARFDADGQPHVVYRRQQIAPDINAQRLQRRHIQRMKPLMARVNEVNQRWQKSGKRLASARRGNEQSMIAVLRGTEHFQLMTTRRPAFGREPIAENGRERAHPIRLAGWIIASVVGKSFPVKRIGNCCVFAVA